MKIVLVQPYGQVGGHQSLGTWHIARALLDTGLDVTVISLNGFRDGWENELPVSHIAVALSPEIKRGAQGLRNRALGNYYELWHVFSRAFELYAQDPEIVVHILDFEPATLSVAYWMHGRPPCILTLGTADFTLATAQGTWAKKIFVSAGGKALANATKNMLIVCHSDRVLKQGLERKFIHTIEQTRLIPSGIDIERRNRVDKKKARCQLGLPLDTRVGVFFGPARPIKGLDLLIEALSRLERGQLKVIVAGTLEYNLGPDPIASASKMDCANDILFISRYVSKDEMDVIFGAADVVLLPYRSNFQGQSDVLLSACEYDLPVIASDTGDLGQRVSMNGLGLLFEPDSVDSICKALLSFLSMSEEDLRKYRDNLTLYANSRPWNQVAKEYAEVYEMVHLLRKKAKR